MIRLTVSAAAQADLDAIAEYIARDDLAAAEQFIEKLTGTFNRLCDGPGIGSPRDDLMAGLRGRAFGSYIIYYHVRPERLEIVRVIHGARDQAKIFGTVRKSIDQ